MRNQTLVSTLLLGFLWLPAWAQTPPKPSTLKPYDQVITSAFKSQSGVFGIHRSEDKLYFEIPKAQLEKDFLLVVQIAKIRFTTGNGGGEPIDERIVRWVRRDNKILLMDVDYRVWADPSLPIAKAVEATNNPTILASFPIEAEAKDGSAVIEVSKLYTSEILEFSPKQHIGAKALDKERCFLDSARTFPKNIEVESTLTLNNPDPPSPFGFSFSWGGKLYRGTATLNMRYSMVLLPEKPMMPRLYDSRVGYFTHRQIDYGSPQHYTDNRRFIARWRLEKKDPTAEVSEPVQPIVFYVDPATPKAWVPYVKRGVEQWQVAFEEAGFKQAIVAKDAPVGDPDWSMEDARYSVIRWVASEVPNAYGPHISDPRSGEILEADIHMFHNILDLQRRWYVSQVGHLDPRARSLPLPDDLMGQLVEFVVAHEVGHSLGLPHNMLASSTYPLSKVRDREWVKKMGHCPSIMDYCRFNYVAQPEDRIDLEDLIPKVGPYDKFSIMWGYKPIPGATSAEAEKVTLDQWARKQDQVPWYRFANYNLYGVDPGDQTESVGDENPVQATRLGLKNLKRIHANLLRTTSEYGESFEQLELFRRQLLGQWLTEVRHTLPLIGGVHRHNKHAGQQGVIFQMVARTRQQEAVDFLLKEFFQPQDWLLDKDILGRTSPFGNTDYIVNAQRSVLVEMFSPRRLNRMAEQTLSEGQKALPPQHLLNQVRGSFFQELSQGLGVSYYRRALQRAWLEVILDLTYSSGEARALAQDQLRRLKPELLEALKRTQDGNTVAHLNFLLSELQSELDPRGSRRKPNTRPFFFQQESVECPGCWHNSQLDALPRQP